MNLRLWELTATGDDGLGVPVAVGPKWQGTDEPISAGGNDIVIFVHGFNNTLQRAEDVWRKETWAELLHQQVPPSSLRKVVLLYWSGCGSSNRALGGLLYPLLVKNAVATAEFLADYLITATHSATVPVDVSFVGHSLGCRVVLETVQRLSQTPTLRVKRLLLMAGAVAEGYCVPWEKFGYPVARVEERVLWSTRDSALKLPFRAGQKLAHDEPATHRRAVGRIGGPTARWSRASCTTRARHGDYWASTATVRHIAHVLDDLPQTREPVPTLRDVDAREIPERNEAARILPNRTL